MKVYLYISQRLRQHILPLKYYGLLSQCDLATTMAEADIVHLLGAWDRRLASVASKARRMGIPYIISPLGGISAWNMRKPTTRRPVQRLCYLRKMVREAGAVTVMTTLEKAFVLSTGWNDKVEYMPASILNSGMSEKGTLSEMQRLYTDVLNRFEQRKAAAISARVDKVMRRVIEDERARIEERSEDNARPDIKAPEEYQTEQALLRQVLRIHSRMAHENIPRSYLVTLQTLLHDTDYDDDLVGATLHRLHNTKYARNLFDVMSHETGLTEGFMPIEAKKGKIAKKINQYLCPDTTI